MEIIIWMTFLDRLSFSQASLTQVRMGKDLIIAFCNANLSCLYFDFAMKKIVKVKSRVLFEILATRFNTFEQSFKSCRFKRLFKASSMFALLFLTKLPVVIVEDFLFDFVVF